MIKTMKKSLSIVLAVAVCLSLFCIPATAVSTDTLPYLLCTYEDGIGNIAQGANDIGTIVEGGVGGLGHALQLPAVSNTDYYLRSKVSNPKYLNGTFPTGSKIKVSFWAKAVELFTENLDFHIYNDNLGTRIGTCIVRNPEIGKWYKFEITFEPTADLTTAYFRLRTMFTGTYCLDDFEASFINPGDAPASSNFTVSGGIATGNQVTFSHTFTPASSSAQDVTDASLVRLVNVTSKGEKTIMGVCGINETMTIPVTSVDSVGMGFEVVPMSSDGKVGNPTTYTPPESVVYANELPYVLCTYEDNARNLSDGTIVEGGLGGSGHALQLTTTKDKDHSLRIKQVESNGAINPTNFSATVPSGSKFVLSFWAKPIGEISNFDFHIFEGYTFGNWATKTKSSECDGWYKWTFTVDADEAKEYGYIRFRTFFAGTCLIDDFEIALVDTADAPASSDFAVTGDTASGNRILFSHTFTPATSSAEGVTDTSLVRLINVSSTGEKAVIGICRINEAMTVPAIPADSARLEFEVVPMSSDSKAGSIVTYSASSEDAIEGITLRRVEGNEIAVATDTKLQNAYLIFVTYGENNRMVDCKVVYVDLEAQNSETFSPVDLTAGNYTKVMLWYDMTDCMPLADMLQY